MAEGVQQSSGCECAACGDQINLVYQMPRVDNYLHTFVYIPRNV